MDVRLSGQVGNWLFHTAAAVKEFGKDALTGAVSCAKRERFERSKAVFCSLCDWLPVKRGRKEDCSAEANRRAARSNWQSLGCIPTRAECMNLFRVKRRTDITYPVIHVRGADYFTYFKDKDVVLGASHIKACAAALGFKVEECAIVTDDTAYVGSLGLKPKSVISGTAVDDFGIMANARHLVMSPSTFSWWAGFIGYHDKVVMPVGVGPWDAGVMKKDLISAQSNAELCWGDECITAPGACREDVALLTICTGRYVDLFKGFYESFKKHVKGSVKLYVLTDDPDRVRVQSNGEAVAVRIEHSKWPGVVMRKYDYILSAKDLLDRHTAIETVQVNARFVKDVDFSTLIGDKILFCHHPYNKPGSKYVCGGVVGGPTGKFMEMAVWMSRYLNDAVSSGNIPKWHDETALNLYKDSQATDYEALPSEFTYAEERPSMKTAASVVMFKDKDKFFGCRKSEYAS